MQSPIVAITGPKLPDATLREISQFAESIRLLPGDLSISELIEALDGVSFYALGGNEYLNERFFLDAPDTLDDICCLATGYLGFIDVLSARSSKIRVSYTPHANVRSTAEFAFGLAIAGARDLVNLAQRARIGQWSLLERPSIFGATVGVLGFGRVGREFTRLMKASFGCDMLVWNRSNVGIDEFPSGVSYATVSDIFSRSDIVSLHFDWKPEPGNYLIGEREFTLAKKSLVLVNTARAFAVDPRALRKFLVSNADSRALFDTYYKEPVGLSNDEFRLLDLENFTITPHAAYLTRESHIAMSRMLIANLRAIATGEPVPFCIPMEN